MNNPTFRHALACLAHPVAFAAAGLLFLNATVFQPTIQAWWTGKLGDLAWMVIAPFFVAAILAWVTSPRWTFRLALIGTGIVFGSAKTIPAVNTLFTKAFHALTGVPLKATLDPTDVMVLPGLLAAWWIWNRTQTSSPARSWQFAGFAFAALAIVADAAAPHGGIVCLTQQGSSVVAIYEHITPSTVGGNRQDERAAYRSADGGLSWNALAEIPACQPKGGGREWSLNDPANPNLQYVFIGGQGVYKTTDGGKTLQRDSQLQYWVADALVHQPSGNLIVTGVADYSGRGMVRVQIPNGTWKDVQVK